MPFLYLIRHPLTEPDPAVPASLWRLSDAGRAQVTQLIAAPFWKSVCVVYTSEQHKAAIAGAAAAFKQGIPHRIVRTLTEAHRDRWLGGDEFRAAQERFFAEPQTPPVPEWEAADAARVRFSGAMTDLLAQHPADEGIAVVAHATVLSLYVAHLRGTVATFDFWRSIGFAAVCAVDRVSMQPVTDFLTAPYAGLPGADQK
ncbi:MAG: phosphoglycerate mutase family protein [Anaerolineae bacterium]|nr:phosphoglycerate mutase family protein [Anaerolineae bacterium]